MKHRLGHFCPVAGYPLQFGYQALIMFAIVQHSLARPEPGSRGAGRGMNSVCLPSSRSVLSAWGVGVVGHVCDQTAKRYGNSIGFRLYAMGEAYMLESLLRCFAAVRNHTHRDDLWPTQKKFSAAATTG
ncbi:MAG: hypothetical protein IPP03_22945 [Dechloromonas sp.]|nr:hypothetical protein [Candidatus Dechloromonas phosphoritropha]